jgi:hypothetical protein
MSYTNNRSPEYSLDKDLAKAINKAKETGSVSELASLAQGLIAYIEYLEALVIRDPDETDKVTLQ